MIELNTSHLRQRVIDVDDRRTWPERIQTCVDEWATHYRGTTKYTADLPVPLEDEAAFRALFRGHLLRVYHCTKLLPYELAMIKTDGLRPLSANLVLDRINAARAAGVFSHDEAEELRRGHVFAMGEHQHRNSQVCFLLSKGMFRYHRDGCAPLLGTWGGEAIYRASGTQHLQERLRSIGVPTVVQAAVDLFSGGDHLFFAALHKTFLGVRLGLKDAGSDVFYRSAVPAANIERIVQVGHCAYRALGVSNPSDCCGW